MEAFFIGPIVFIIGQIVLIWLAKRRAQDVRAILLVFCLTMVACGIGYIWLDIAKASMPSNATEFPEERFFEKIESYAEDWGLDFVIGACLLAILTIPQTASYLICSIYGCAAKPRLISWGVSFLVWTTIKGLMVFAGIITARNCAMILTASNLDELGNGLYYLLFSAYWFSYPIIILGIYRGAETLASKMIGLLPPSIHKGIARFHRWASRNEIAAG